MRSAKDMTKIIISSGKGMKGMPKMGSPMDPDDEYEGTEEEDDNTEALRSVGSSIAKALGVDVSKVDTDALAEALQDLYTAWKQ